LKRPSDDIAHTAEHGGEHDEPLVELCRNNDQSDQDPASFDQAKDLNTTADLISLDAQDCSPGPSTWLGPSDRKNLVASRPRMPRKVVGCARADERLPVCTAVSELFLYNVGRDADNLKLQEFLNSKSLRFLGLDQVSHSDSRAKSYLLTVPLKDEDMALDPRFWPQNIQCRKFVRPRTGRLARKE
jgi:hypothetical protein